MPLWYRMKTSSKKHGASQSDARLLGLMSSLVHLSRWKDFVVYHGREVPKQLLNGLKRARSKIFYATNLKYLGPRSGNLLGACKQLQLVLLSTFRKKYTFLCLFRKKKYT